MTEEQIELLKSGLGEEKFSELMNWFAKENLPELKKKARNKVKNKFVKVLRKHNTMYLDNLSSNHNVRKETANLLNQANNTLKNVHKLIKNNSIVDANSLLRSSFENLIMGMMIYYDDNVYDEFINLNIDETTRTLTKPQKLRNEFRKVLRLVDEESFNEMSNRFLKNMLDEFYDKLCLFTHSTLMVNAIVELEKINCVSIYIFALKQNAYFVEYLLYMCLRYLNNFLFDNIDILYIVVGFFIILSDINKDELTDKNICKLKELLYIDINEAYFNKSNELVGTINNDLVDLQKLIEENPMSFFCFLYEIVK